MSASTIWQLEKRREEDRKMLNNITFIRQNSQIYCCYLHFAFDPLKHENRNTVFCQLKVEMSSTAVGFLTTLVETVVGQKLKGCCVTVDSVNR